MHSSSNTPHFDSHSDSGARNQFTPGLYLVSTPIGNLRDMTLRAIDVLQGADWCAAEDTRVSGKLLQAYDIKTRLRSCHEHNEDKMAVDVVNDIKAGQIVAFISDAGTPLVSDPGYRLVQACIEHDLNITPIPGANAVLPALQVSGLPTNEFYFAGFLPSKNSARRRKLESLKDINATMLFYEAPHRLIDMLEDANKILGARQASISREITKKFEETRRQSLPELLQHYQTNGAPKGEVVIVIEGAPAPEKWDEDRITETLEFAFSNGAPFREAVALITTQSGRPKRTVYNLATKLKTQP